MGVFARGSKLWIRFRDVDGKWRNTRTGYDVGQETLAEEMLAGVNRRVLEEGGQLPASEAKGTLRALTIPYVVNASWCCSFCGRREGEVTIVLGAAYSNDIVTICAGCASLAARGAAIRALSAAEVKPRGGKGTPKAKPARRRRR